MTRSKDLAVDVHKVSSMPTNVEWGDASSSKVLGLGKVVISHDLTIEKFMLVGPFHTIYFPFVKLDS